MAANLFQGPMQPFTGLERWAHQRTLARVGANLFFYDSDGETRSPVLLVHGLGDEADTWRHVLPLLSANHRVIAPDLPGFGRSDPGAHKLSIPFFVDTLLELLDELSLARVILVGHSMGAVIAHALALEHPERVERLVLVSGSLVSKENRITPDLLMFLVPGLGEWSYNRLRKDPGAAYRSLEGYYHHLESLPQADRDFLYQRVNERVWSDRQRRGFLSALRSLAAWIGPQQKELPARLSGWQIPTIVIWGENDRVSPVTNAYALKTLVPSARLVIVPGAGHNLQQEQAEVITEAVQ